MLLAGSGLLLLVHRNVQGLAERIVRHTHLNPASRYPRIFLEWADTATPERFRLLALGAACYAVVRFVEAAGLWRDRRWAEWFGVATGLVYVPFEARAFARHPGLESVVALLVNLGVVLYLAWRLWRHTPPDQFAAPSGST